MLIRQAGQAAGQEPLRSPAAPRPSANSASPPARPASDEVAVSHDSGSLESLGQQALERANQLESAWAESRAGNPISRGLNAVVGKFSGHDSDVAQQVEAALKAYRGLPDELRQLQTDLAALQQQPGRSQQRLQAFRSRLQAIEALGTAAEASLGQQQSARKFWSGLTAEITSTVLVNGAAVLASRRLGLPLNAATAAAGFVLGGSTNVASHAIFDSQYQLRREGLGNFLSAGVGSAALVLTATAGKTSLKRLATTQAVVAATTAGVGATAREATQGFQDGWQKRLAAETLIGAGVGAVSGVAGASLSSLLPQTGSTLTQKALQATVGATTGALGAGAAGTLSEGFSGFSTGWQQRVQRQLTAGALTGAVMSLAPSLEAPASRSQAASPASEADTPAPAGSQTSQQPEPTPAAQTVQHPPGPSETSPPLQSDSPEQQAQTTLLDYARSKELQAFDQLVNDHVKLYDWAQPQPKPLLDADGQVIPSQTGPSSSPMGYGTAPPTQLLKPDGTPVHPSPYGSGPPPQLIDVHGQPLHATPAPQNHAPEPHSGTGVPETVSPSSQSPPAKASPLSVHFDYSQTQVEPDSYRVRSTELGNTKNYVYVNTPAKAELIQLTINGPESINQTSPLMSATQGSKWQATQLFDKAVRYDFLDKSFDAPMSVNLNASRTLAATFLYVQTPTQVAPLPTLMSYTSLPLGASATTLPQSITIGQISVTNSGPLLAALPGKAFGPPALPGAMSPLDAGKDPAQDAGASFASGYGTDPGSYGGYGSAYANPYGTSYGSAAPVLYGPDGLPLTGPALGYGTPAPQLLGPDGQPVSSQPGLSYGSGALYGGPQLLGADGQPIHGAGYGTPPVQPLVKPDGTPVKKALKDEIYSSIFANDPLRDRTIEAFTQWTATYSQSEVQQQMREAWTGVIQGKPPESALEKTLFDVYTTRQQRWSRLADKLGLAGPPKEFQLYRGVHGDRFVESVVQAWRDSGGSDMQVPVHTLSSWSLTRNTAESFAGSGTSVIFEAQVPFARTLADKFVDDGSFITSFSRENEVVVALSEQNGLSTPKDKVTVTYQGKSYSYAERASLIQAWDAAHAATPAAAPGN